MESFELGRVCVVCRESIEDSAASMSSIPLETHLGKCHHDLVKSRETLHELSWLLYELAHGRRPGSTKRTAKQETIVQKMTELIDAWSEKERKT
jgi:hypothetical protein